MKYTIYIFLKKNVVKTLSYFTYSEMDKILKIVIVTVDLRWMSHTMRDIIKYGKYQK